MKRAELRRRLEQVELPGEQAATERAWPLLQAAFAERERIPRPGRRLRPVLVLAAALALVAAVVSPPGRAVLSAVRDAVVGVEDAEPALFRLPAGGRLLATTDSGSWVVHADGSKRLLAGYGQASWSPYGRFVVTARRNELVALEPNGRVRWSLARPEVRRPRWGGTREDTRIAYLSGDELRVVAGDGTGDRLAAPNARTRVAPAWRPGPGHVLAYALPDATIAVLDVEGRRLVWLAEAAGRPRELAWSPDGRRLLVATDEALVVYAWNRPRPLATLALRGLVDVVFAPGSRRFAALRSGELLLLDADRLQARPERVFAGPGSFTGVTWSPDGRWLLLAWEDADQWLFIRPAGVEQVEAVSGISRQFGVFPELGGWVLP